MPQKRSAVLQPAILGYVTMQSASRVGRELAPARSRTQAVEPQMAQICTDQECARRACACAVPLPANT
jgi:hypothetical protein